MQSCAGMLRVITCRLTLLIRSTTGLNRVSPGPRGGSWTLPRRKTTPLSYCWTTRTDRNAAMQRMNNITATTMRMVSMANPPNLLVSVRGRRRRGLSGPGEALAVSEYAQSSEPEASVCRCRVGPRDGGGRPRRRLLLRAQPPVDPGSHRMSVKEFDVTVADGCGGRVPI